MLPKACALSQNLAEEIERVGIHRGFSTRYALKQKIKTN